MIQMQKSPMADSFLSVNAALQITRERECYMAAQTRTLLTVVPFQPPILEEELHAGEAHRLLARRVNGQGAHLPFQFIHLFRRAQELVVPVDENKNVAGDVEIHAPGTPPRPGNDHLVGVHEWIFLLFERCRQGPKLTYP
jgi:hypothetical protein